MKVEIYGKDDCPMCVQAQNITEGVTEEVSMLKVGKDYQLPELFQKIGNPVRQFPQVFVDDSYVGGYKEYEAYIKELKSKPSVEDTDLEDLDDLEI